MTGALVVSQVALALVLLVAAGLLIRSFLRLNAVSPGYETANLLMAQVPFPAYKYAPGAPRVGLYREIHRRVAALPGIVSVALASSFPGGGIVAIHVEGQPILDPGKVPQVEYRAVSPGFFTALNLPLRRGREFNEHDTEDRTLVAIVDERMAERFWPGQDAIGKRFRRSAEGPWLTVVGVAAAIDRRSTRVARPEFYAPYTQAPPTFAMQVLARTKTPPLSMASFVREAIWSADRDLAIRDVKTAERELEEQMWQARLSMLLISVFASLALVLAGVGIYGVMSSAVSQRSREMGIRMALGARPFDVSSMVVRQGLGLAAAGISAGGVVALLLARLLGHYLHGFNPSDPAQVASAHPITPAAGVLFGVRATDSVTLASVALLLLLVSLLACYLPARRATRIDPLAAVRND